MGAVKAGFLSTLKRSFISRIKWYDAGDYSGQGGPIPAGIEENSSSTRDVVGLPVSNMNNAGFAHFSFEPHTLQLVIKSKKDLDGSDFDAPPTRLLPTYV